MCHCEVLLTILHRCMQSRLDILKARSTHGSNFGRRHAQRSATLHCAEGIQDWSPSMFVYTCLMIRAAGRLITLLIESFLARAQTETMHSLQTIAMEGWQKLLLVTGCVIYCQPLAPEVQTPRTHQSLRLQHRRCITLSAAYVFGLLYCSTILVWFRPSAH